MKCTYVLFPLVIILFTAPATFSQQVAAPVEEKKFTIDVKDTDIKDVIRIISKGYDINILLDQDITGKVTLHLVDVPIMEGLRSIAASSGLEVVQDGTVFKIRKASEERRSMIRYSNDKLTVDVQNVDEKDFLKELSSKTAVSMFRCKSFRKVTESL
jgi:type IV pilus assembly protein PilQ